MNPEQWSLSISPGHLEVGDGYQLGKMADEGAQPPTATAAVVSAAGGA